MFRKSLLLVFLFITTSFSTFAHEGHGLLNGHEPGHYLFSPEHAIPLLLALALVAILVTRKLWRSEKE